MKKLFVVQICAVSMFAVLSLPLQVIAQVQSDNFIIDDYSLGESSTDPNMGSASYKLFGVAGESGTLSGGTSQNYTYNGGLVYAMQTAVPLTPTLENPATFYDRLKFVLDPGTNAADFVYAIAISKDDFATTQYISKDLTPVASLSAADWQTYAAWGGASGAVVTGLESGSDYQIKVKSRQGEFTESDYSMPAAASTVWPSLTFSVNGSADMGVWREENNYSSTAVSTLTTSTNAYNGYSIYAYATQPLTRQNGSETIANISASYANPISWISGLGFGYTTNDTSIAGVQKWNKNPCPGDNGAPLCYAPFSHTGPGDVVADHESTQDTTAIVDETFSLTYKAVTQATQVAGTYTTTIVYTIVPTY